VADVTATYDGNEIGSLSNSGTMTLETAGTYCDDDIEIVYVKSGGGGGTDISDSTVTPADVLSGVSVYVWNSQTQTASKESGTITRKSAATYNTSSSDQTIASGQYLEGAQTIKAVETSGISAANIKYGTQVKVGDANDDDRIANVTGTFTASNTVSSGQSAAGAGQIVSGYSAWVDGAEVQGSISGKTSSDLTVSGDTVTAPAGVYASAASKSVASGVVLAPSTITANGAQVTISSNVFSLSAAPVSVTPYVQTPGYISAGTTSGSAITLSTTDILVKSAATYDTSATDRDISAGQYLNGTQTIKAVQTSNISANNIKYNVNVKVGDSNEAGRIANVTGTFTAANTVSSGQTAATSTEILSGYSAWVNGVEVIGEASGGGGLTNDDAILTVWLPANSTVTMVNTNRTPSISLTPTIWTAGTDNTMESALFVVPSSLIIENPQDPTVNDWTVTATNGGDSSDTTVRINSAKSFEWNVDFGVYIIKNGVLQSGYTATVNTVNKFEAADGYFWLKGGATQDGYGYISGLGDYTYKYLVVQVSNERTHSGGGSKLVVSKVSSSSYNNTTNRISGITLPYLQNDGPKTWVIDVDGYNMDGRYLIFNVSGDSLYTYLYITNVYFTNTNPS